MNFDLDDNGYLKKAEFVEAAKAFTAEGEAEAEDSTEDTSQEDEPPQAVRILNLVRLNHLNKKRRIAQSVELPTLMMLQHVLLATTRLNDLER